MLAPVPARYQGQVVELGTGTGTLTLPLAAKCPQATIRACEINPVLAEDARQNLARAGINGRVEVLAASAEELLADILSRTGPRPEYILSGLPLGNMRKEQVLSLLQAIRKVLPEKGMFIQTQHFLVDRKRIRNVFGRLRTVPVLFNLPPAFVYYAWR
jgi:phospholipid N-methyltransferase